MGEGFELVRASTGDWCIRARDVGEVCHPGLGPRGEADALYLRGLNLRERIASARGDFCVWDVGLGGAANAIAVMDAAAAQDVTLTVLSFDRSTAQLEFAVRHARELGYFGELLPMATRLLEAPEIAFEHGRARVHWRRVPGEFPALVDSPAADEWPGPDAILFDPYSPSVNPEMWTVRVFTALARRTDPARPCGLATYSRSTAVRVALLLAGWFVGIGDAVGRKEETTIAATRLDLLRNPLGRRWLERARRSDMAEPWEPGMPLKRPLSESSWERLRGHRQWS